MRGERLDELEPVHRLHLLSDECLHRNQNGVCYFLAAAQLSIHAAVLVDHHLCFQGGNWSEELLLDEVHAFLALFDIPTRL